MPSRKPQDLRSEVICKSSWFLKALESSCSWWQQAAAELPNIHFQICAPSCFLPTIRLRLLDLPTTQTQRSTATTTLTAELYEMCLSCGCWPWGNALRVADAPNKDEYIFLGANHSFYPDHRVVSEDSYHTFPPLCPRIPPNTASST